MPILDFLDFGRFSLFLSNQLSHQKNETSSWSSIHWGTFYQLGNLLACFCEKWESLRNDVQNRQNWHLSKRI